MSNQTLVSVGISAGRMEHRQTQPLAVVKCALALASDRQLTNSVICDIVKALGESFMTWQQVAVIAILVLGGCFLGFTGHETLAGALIGGAAGFVSQPLFKPQSRHKPASSLPYDAP